MFDKNEFVEFLKENFPEGHVVSSGTEFVCRCRLCGDSATNPDKMRFYISLAHPTGLIFFNCFNCGSGGLLTPDRLRKLCDAPSELLLDLSNFNRSTINTIPYLSKTRVRYIRPEIIIDDDINRAKLSYINKRLGLNLTYEDYQANKIVFSLGSLIKANSLELTMAPKTVKELDTFFMGTIGMNNCNINLKNLNQGHVLPYIDKRFINYKLFANNLDDRRFYSIPVLCDMNKRVRVNIAEGMMDINSIFFNLRDGNRSNEMYFGVGSKAYKSVIAMCLEEFGMLDVEFHLYMDMDVEYWYKDQIYKILEPLGISSYIHQNLYPGKKDYGFPIEYIKDSQVTLTKGW